MSGRKEEKYDSGKLQKVCLENTVFSTQLSLGLSSLTSQHLILQTQFLLHTYLRLAHPSLWHPKKVSNP